MVLLPRICVGLFPVRSPLLGESLVYFLFLGVLRCFSSPRLPLYTSCTDNYPSGNWVVPFGNPWIKGYLLLPMAYRSLSRPSSPPRAKASTRRPNFLSPLLIPIKRNKVAHTISCNFEIITQFLKTKSSLLTVLCVNMSKISVRTPRLRRFRYRVEVRIDCAYAASILSHYVENNGFEPLTPCLQSRCSSQLS